MKWHRLPRSPYEKSERDQTIGFVLFALPAILHLVAGQLLFDEEVVGFLSSLKARMT